MFVPIFLFYLPPIVFISKMGGSFKMMPLFSLVLLLLVPFSFQLWPDGWMVGRWICGSPHATFLPPSWFLSSEFRLTVSTLSLEGLVLCESNSCGSLTLGFTGVFYSFSSWDFVVAVVLKNIFLYLKVMVLVLYFSKMMNELSGRHCSNYLDSLNLTLIFFTVCTVFSPILLWKD